MGRENKMAYFYQFQAKASDAFAFLYTPTNTHGCEFNLNTITFYFTYKTDVHKLFDVRLKFCATFGTENRVVGSVIIYSYIILKRSNTADTIRPAIFRT